MLPLIFNIIILSLLSITSITTLTQINQVISAKNTLSKLNYTISLARIYALKTNTTIKICPNKNKEDNWNNGWNIQNSDKQYLGQFSLKVLGSLKIHTFGPPHDCLNILPNGMTQDNGHFTYLAASPLYNINTLLLFNKGLRTYYVKEN